MDLGVLFCEVDKNYVQHKAGLHVIIIIIGSTVLGATWPPRDCK